MKNRMLLYQGFESGGQMAKNEDYPESIDFTGKNFLYVLENLQCGSSCANVVQFHKSKNRNH